MGDRVKFLAAFLKRPFDTGSITPSSEQLAATMVEGMDIAQADTVIELGPGTGVFTRVILERLRADAKLFCFEINPELAEDLRDRFPRAHIVNDSIEHLRKHLDDAGRGLVDLAISGLPWAAFSPPYQRALLKSAVDALKPGARFATFAYSHAAWMPPARRFRDLLEETFSEVTTSPVVWRNVPPAFVYRCRK